MANKKNDMMIAKRRDNGRAIDGAWNAMNKNNDGDQTSRSDDS